MASARMLELAKATMSGDNNERTKAEELFKEAKKTSPSELIVGLTQAIGEQSCEEATRMQATVLLRQLVWPGHAADDGKDFPWCKLDGAARQQVASLLLELFKGNLSPKLQSKVGDVLEKLASTVHSIEKGYLAEGQRGWPGFFGTICSMADASKNPNVASCENAINLLKDCIDTFKADIGDAQAALGVVVQTAFQAQDMKLQVAAFVLVSEMVTILEKKDWAPLMATANVLTQIIQKLFEGNMHEELASCLQSYMEIAAIEPDFFKNQLQQGSLEPAATLAKLVQAKTGEEDTLGIRNLAMEWLTTFAEKRSKWITSKMPQLGHLSMECCMFLMKETEDGPDALKEWVERMDDEEGEEDMDPLYHCGEESIDRLVQNLGIEHTSQALFTLIGQYASRDNWQDKLAALTAIKQTVEYVEESHHVDEMAKMLLAHVEHAHPRLRYTSLHALGQLSNDQAPQFQDSWHPTVMPVLLKMMDDTVDRVSSMAMSAFVTFGEELENALMSTYAHTFMEKLVCKLQSTHRMVQEESITSIAVIAGVIGKDFSQYYAGIMPLLKVMVLTKTGKEENRLRGKAFECMSLLGLAVGKEKFLPDSQEAVMEMLKTSMAADADDLQRDYIKEASERICKCLGKDFAIFLPTLLPNIFRSLQMNAEDKVVDPTDEEDYTTVADADGKLVKVRSSKFEEMVQAIELLKTYCVEMEGSFFDFVPQVAEALMPFLTSDDKVLLLCDEARSSAFQAWAALIKAAQMGAKERGIAPELANTLLRTFLSRICAEMSKDSDADTLKDAASGLAECLKNVPHGTLTAQEVQELSRQLFKFIDDSFIRSMEIVKRKKAGAAGAPVELQDDEEDEDDEEEEEEQCRSCLEDALGALMKAAPTEFLGCIEECNKRLSGWLPNKDHKTIGLFLACDMLDHLKEMSTPAWPTFMPHVFNSLTDKEASVRIPAAYAIGLAASIPAFAEAADKAFRALAQIVSAAAPKKRDEQGKVAMDNAVSALLLLARHQSAKCPAEIDAWKLVVGKLPITDDEEEAKKVHKWLVEMVLEQHPGLLGPDNANLSKVLSALAEVYTQEVYCAPETDECIVKIFKMLPADALQRMASSFTVKQQKKIEKLLTSA